MFDAYTYDGLRTLFVRHAGDLAAVSPDNMAAHVIRALVKRNAFEVVTTILRTFALGQQSIWFKRSQYVNPFTVIA